MSGHVWVRRMEKGRFVYRTGKGHYAVRLGGALVEYGRTIDGEDIRIGTAGSMQAAKRAATSDGAGGASQPEAAPKKDFPGSSEGRQT